MNSGNGPCKWLCSIVGPALDDDDDDDDDFGRRVSKDSNAVGAATHTIFFMVTSLEIVRKEDQVRSGVAL